MTLEERIRSKEATVAVVGVGYVGLPLAYEKARAGFEVVGIDDSAFVVDTVNRGESHISDVEGGDLKKLVESGRLRATRDFKPVGDADVVTICVPTPLDSHKNPDTTFIESVLERAGPHLHAGQLIVLESTTYPGTTEEVIVPAVEEHGFQVGEDIHVAYSPERVDPGNKEYGVQNTPKVVGGATPACTDVARALYETALEADIHVVSEPKVAEMTKLLENIFRIVNVSMMNELAQLSDRMELDLWEAIDAAATKPFGFTPFYPGPGVGGHCIPIDPFYLEWKAREHDTPAHFIKLAGEINDQMPRYVVDQTARLLNDDGKTVRDASILLIGLAYKADVGDTRESAALAIADELDAWGAHVRYHDPFVPAWTLQGEEQASTPLTPETLQDQDLVIIATAHSTVDYDAIAEHAPLIYDTRNALESHTHLDHVHRLGAPDHA